MSKANLSSNRSTRRSALTGSYPRFDMPRTIRFTLDNEQVHEISFGLENEGPQSESARTSVPGQRASLAHSPSDDHLALAPDCPKTAQNIEEPPFLYITTPQLGLSVPGN